MSEMVLDRVQDGSGPGFDAKSATGDPDPDSIRRALVDARIELSRVERQVLGSDPAYRAAAEVANRAQQEFMSEVGRDPEYQLAYGAQKSARERMDQAEQRILDNNPSYEAAVAATNWAAEFIWPSSTSAGIKRKIFDQTPRPLRGREARLRLIGELFDRQEAIKHLALAPDDDYWDARSDYDSKGEDFDYVSDEVLDRLSKTPAGLASAAAVQERQKAMRRALDNDPAYQAAQRRRDEAQAALENLLR